MRGLAPKGPEVKLKDFLVVVKTKNIQERAIQPQQHITEQEPVDITRHGPLIRYKAHSP